MTVTPFAGPHVAVHNSYPRPRDRRALHILPGNPADESRTLLLLLLLLFVVKESRRENH
jgi:hypothetical protein